MKKVKVIVLSSVGGEDTTPTSTDTVPVSTTSLPPAQGFSLNVRELSSTDVEDFRKEKNVVAAARPMPIKLIRQVSAGANADVNAVPPQRNWGIGAVKADQSPFTGEGVTVAVLDTGIADHAAFPIEKVVRRNFTTEAPQDLDGHGTHCAGTIFGNDVNNLRIGVARGVSKALIAKVIGDGGGSTEQLVDAIHWAMLEKAQVISMSLGMDFVGYRESLKSEGYSDAEATSLALAGYRDNIRLFDKLSAALSSKLMIAGDAVVVAAAGNESKRPTYSITVAPPAAAEYFQSVAAIDANNKIADFSNNGALFAAPGVDIWSAKPGGGVTAMSGTSMATPHVAGVAALWAQKQRTVDGHFSAARTIEMMTKACLPLTPINDARFGLVQAPLE